MGVRAGRNAAAAFVLMLAAILLPAALPSAHRPAPAPEAIKKVASVHPHVMIIVAENREYGNVIGTSAAPYINKTLIPAYTNVTNWFAIQHTSLNDYLELVSGSNQGYPTNKGPYPGPTLVDELSSAGYSWKGYMESAPSACYKGGSVEPYDKTHNPFMWFSSVLNSSAQCNRVVPYSLSQISSDLNSSTPPDFVWITPNNCNNMHGWNATGSPCNNFTKAQLTTAGDTWLKNNLPTVLSSSWFTSGGAVIITFDEGTTKQGFNGTTGGHIPTLVLTPGNHSTYATGGNLYGTLRGIEGTYGVGFLGASSSAANGDLSQAFGQGSISGTVTDAQTSAAVQGATVTCSCQGSSATTDSSGKYSFSAVPAGSYTLTFAATGYATQTISNVTVTAGAATTQNAALNEDGSIGGTVTDAQTTTAIQGATVTCSCQGPAATTDSAGKYSFSNVPAGSYTLTFSASGYATQTISSVTVTAGAATTQNAALTPSHQAAFSDGFESGNLSAWTTTSGLTVESTTVHTGTYAAEGNVSSASGYAQKLLPSTYTDAYERVYFDIKSMGTQVNILRARTAAAGNVAFVFVTTGKVLGLNLNGTRYLSTQPVTLNTWHELELNVNTSTGAAQVWLDGTLVSSLSKTATLGTPVGMMQIGESALQTWDMVLDDAVFDTQYIS